MSERRLRMLRRRSLRVHQRPQNHPPGAPQELPPNLAGNTHLCRYVCSGCCCGICTGPEARNEVTSVALLVAVALLLLTLSACSLAWETTPFAKLQLTLSLPPSPASFHATHCFSLVLSSLLPLCFPLHLLFHSPLTAVGTFYLPPCFV